MRDPYDLMKKNAHYNEVLKAAAQSSDEELARIVSRLHDEELIDIAVYTSITCRKFSVKHTLIMGCLFHLFAIAVEAEGRREFFENLLDDLEISQTQAYRCRAAWCCFGAKFLSEPKLSEYFVTEALKILAAEGTPEAAREEALKIARQENRVSIRLAQSLVQKHSDGLLPGGDVPVKTQGEESRDAGSQAVSRSPKNWLFSGNLLRIQLLPAAKEGATVEALIQELKSAITALKHQSISPTEPSPA